MTSEQHPGGVAGRVLGSMIDAGRTYSLHGYHEEMEFRREGAEELLDGLSREARAILAEITDDAGYNPCDDDTPDEQWPAEPTVQHRTLKRAFTRLGLDLESEDE